MGGAGHHVASADAVVIRRPQRWRIGLLISIRGLKEAGAVSGPSPEVARLTAVAHQPTRQATCHGLTAPVMEHLYFAGWNIFALLASGLLTGEACRAGGACRCSVQFTPVPPG